MKRSAWLNLFLIIITSILFSACKQAGPEAIKLNKDDCDNCKMSISDKRFGCEIVTGKGKTYKFDDVHCMIDFSKEYADKMANAVYYISDYNSPNQLTISDQLTFVSGENVGSPMGGNVAAFIGKPEAETMAKKWNASIVKWEDIKN